MLKILHTPFNLQLRRPFSCPRLPLGLDQFRSDPLTAVYDVHRLVRKVESLGIESFISTFSKNGI